MKLKAAITKLRNENKTLLDKSSGPSKKPSIPCPKSSGFKVSMLSKAYSTEPKVESAEVANSSLLEMLLKRNASRPQECSADDISLTRKRMLDDREQMKQLLALKQRTEIVKSFSSNSTSSFQSEEEIEELLTALVTKKGSD